MIYLEPFCYIQTRSSIKNDEMKHDKSHIQNISFFTTTFFQKLL